MSNSQLYNLREVDEILMRLEIRIGSLNLKSMQIVQYVTLEIQSRVKMYVKKSVKTLVRVISMLVIIFILLLCLVQYKVQKDKEKSNNSIQFRTILPSLITDRECFHLQATLHFLATHQVIQFYLATSPLQIDNVNKNSKNIVSQCIKLNAQLDYFL